MMLATIDPQEARRMLGEGAILVDIREPGEHARARIPEARNIPLGKLSGQDAIFRAGKPLIFHCLSGMRTRANDARLMAEGCEVYLLEGGLNAWRSAGLPVIVDHSQPIDIQRQVQIVAGALGLGGTVLGLKVSPWFFTIPAFVGSGLLFAGVTGFCGMAILLMQAPWNRNAKKTAR